MATSVACGWAGAVISLPTNGPTNGATDGLTDGPTTQHSIL